MKICHVITRMIVGGAQENTLLTCRGQIEAGHKVFLVTGPSPGPEGELLAKVQCPGLEILEIPELVREISPLKDFTAIRKLGRMFRLRRFDVVHTHSSKAGVLGRVAAWRAGVPCVVHTIHGQAFHAYEKAWKNQLYISSERYAARHCHKIFAVARAMVAQCVVAKIAPRAKYKVVYSGMDIASFETATCDPVLRRELGIPENAVVIGTLARLFELKGYEFVLPAARLVLDQYPDTHILIVGDGVLRAELERKVVEMGMGKNFHFAGLIAPERVPGYLRQMDLLWHLSLREGLPRSVVQALATGIPAIAFRLDGAPEVLHDGVTGFCVAPEDYRAVAAKTVELLQAPERRRAMGMAGRELVRERFDWRRMAQILLVEYQKILESNGR